MTIGNDGGLKVCFPYKRCASWLLESQGFEVTMELLWRPILLPYGDIWSETFVGFGNFFPDTSKTSLPQLSPYAGVTVKRNSMELRFVEFEKVEMPVISW